MHRNSGCGTYSCKLENSDFFRNLTLEDMSRATLAGALVPELNLSGPNLHSADLKVANLSGMTAYLGNLAADNLTEHRMHHANVTDSNLTQVRLHGVKLDNAFRTSLAFVGTHSNDAYLVVNSLVNSYMRFAGNLLDAEPTQNKLANHPFGRRCAHSNLPS